MKYFLNLGQHFGNLVHILTKLFYQMCLIFLLTNISQILETYPKYWKPGLNMDQDILRNLSYFYLVKLGRNSGNKVRITTKFHKKPLKLELVLQFQRQLYDLFTRLDQRLLQKIARGYFFYLGFRLEDSRKLGPDYDQDSSISTMIP